MASPFVHAELLTKDVDKSRKFYASMFDCEVKEIPGMDYIIIDVGEGTVGGMKGFPLASAATSPMQKRRAVNLFPI